MTICPSCGTENADGAKFCVKCGAQIITPAPEPGAWRADAASGSGSSSGEVANPPYEPTGNPANYSAPNAPPSSYVPPPSTYDAYGQQQQPLVYQQQGAAEPMHPAIPALVSLFIPGLGLLFVPNKAGLGIGIFAGYVALCVVLTVLAVITLGLGTCLFFLLPIANVGAAVHSWDEAAKASGGKFQPILFKS